MLKTRKRFWMVVLALALLYTALNVTGKSRIAVRRYEINSPKVSGSVRIAFLTDLHNSRYGAEAETLRALLAEEQPDLVLFGGDMFHREGPDGNTMALLTAAAQAYPCYFIAGNHEIATKRLSEIKARVRAAGVTVLDGWGETVNVNGSALYIGGVDAFNEKQPGPFAEQLASAAAGVEKDVFSILLAHQPDYIAQYRGGGYDLMLSGHTHGGQIIVPGVVNGLYAPGQGWFPRYGGGRYDFSDGALQTLIVSRGLSKKPVLAPRVCNPPEVCVITVSNG